MKRILILGLVMALVLTGCGKPSKPIEEITKETPPAAPPSEPLVFDMENLPRIDGSTATIPLAEAVYATGLDKDRNDCKQYVNFSGTNNAYRNLIDENADILLVYEMPDEAAEYMQGVELEIAPIGKDALVFLVNVNNPVKNLTTKQIVDIYSGKITNWRNVGGNNADIKAFQRNATSGSQTLMKKLVMKGVPMMDAPLNIVEGMGELIDVISTYNNSDFALGYNVYYYVSQMKNDSNVAILSVDGIIPHRDSIGGGKYPFVNDFYAVIRKDEPQDSPARKLFDWMQSKDGQRLIGLEGYVSYTQ